MQEINIDNAHFSCHSRHLSAICPIHQQLVNHGLCHLDMLLFVPLLLFMGVGMLLYLPSLDA
jgi:hypothetical protein